MPRSLGPLDPRNSDDGNIIVGIGQRFFGLLPQLDDDVVVEVTGQPGHNKQQLYYLALAAANGIVRRKFAIGGIATAFAKLGIEYDAASNWVRCSLAYRWGTAATNVATTGLPGAGTQAYFDSLAVFRGPQCNVVGGNFDFVTDPITIPGLPSSSTPKAFPNMPFVGSVVATSCPQTTEPTPTPMTQNPAPDYPAKAGTIVDSPNPKPSGDNRSRGSVSSGTGTQGHPTPGNCCDKIMLLVPLVYAALSSPATDADMTFPNPTPGPRGG